jgi:hypothetical protein
LRCGSKKICLSGMNGLACPFAKTELLVKMEM